MPVGYQPDPGDRDAGRAGLLPDTVPGTGGGLLTSTLVTLIVVPVIFGLIGGW